MSAKINPCTPASELIQHVKRVTPHNARQVPVGGVLFKTGDVGGEFAFRLKQDEAGTWAEARRTNTADSYRQFLEAFPGGAHAQEARKQIAELEETAAWESARATNTIAAYDRYLSKYPNSKKAREAVDAMEKLEETNAWNLALSRNSVPALRKYILGYPQSPKREEAEKRIRAILESEREPQAWQEVQRLDSIGAYNGYLKEFPAGANAGAARSRIRELELKEKEGQRARDEAAQREQQQAAEKAKAKVAEPPKAQPYAQAPAQGRKKTEGPGGGGLRAWPSWLKAAIPIGVAVLAIFLIWKWSNSPGAGALEPQEPEAAATASLPAAVGMVIIKGGSFEMGDTFGDGQDDEKPVHTVTVSDFEIGRHEVTVEEFSRFVNASGYKTDAEKGDGSYVWDGKEWKKKAGIDWRHDAAGKLRPSGEYKHPVIHISWNDAVAYCNWLSEQHGYQKVYSVSGTPNWNANGYRLPTEAEWEFAARSRGKKEKWAGTSEENTLASYANYWEGGSKGKDGYEYTSPVGSFRPNNAGLYDMSGNVWEWCWDWYDSKYYEKSNNAQDPKGPDSGSLRVLRGGSWRRYPANVRVANRSYDSPEYRYVNLGFRLARAVR